MNRATIRIGNPKVGVGFHQFDCKWAEQDGSAVVLCVGNKEARVIHGAKLLSVTSLTGYASKADKAEKGDGVARKRMAERRTSEMMRKRLAAKAGS